MGRSRTVDDADAACARPPPDQLRCPLHRRIEWTRRVRLANLFRCALRTIATHAAAVGATIEPGTSAGGEEPRERLKAMQPMDLAGDGSHFRELNRQRGGAAAESRRGAWSEGSS